MLPIANIYMGRSNKNGSGNAPIKVLPHLPPCGQCGGIWPTLLLISLTVGPSLTTLIQMWGLKVVANIIEYKW